MPAAFSAATPLVKLGSTWAPGPESGLNTAITGTAGCACFAATIADHDGSSG